VELSAPSVAAAANFAFGFAPPTGTSFNYTGTGTGTFYHRGPTNGALSIQQSQISSLASPYGQTLTQATAANRPQLLWTNGTLYSAANMSGTAGWRPVMYGDGVNDFIKGAYSGLSRPFTRLICSRFANAYAATEYLYDAATYNSCTFRRTAATSLAMDAGGSPIQCAGTLVSGTSMHSFAVVYNGTSSVVYEDGAVISTASGTGTNAADGLSLFALSNGVLCAAAYVYRVIDVPRIVTAAEAVQWYRYCKANYPGVA
jgi:hypothetical protein